MARGGGGIIVKVGTEYDGKDLARAQREVDKLAKAIQPAGAGFVKVGEQIQKAGQKMSAFGSTLTRNVTLPLAAVAAGAVVAINKASDLSETISKVGVLFGDSAKDIETWSKTAATSLGQSQQQALDAASTFAIFGQSAGLQGKQLVDFSTNLTSLATDLASFNNTSPDDAIQAIGAALRGEAEPLRRYGVLLDDATLKAAALKMGIYDGEGALTAQQKVLAANKVIFDQTATAQGDFARTSGGLANQTRILRAQMEDVTAQIGKALLPIALELVGMFRDRVVPIIQRAADWFGSLSEDTIKMAAGIAAVAAAVGPALVVFGGLTSHLGGLVAAIGPVISAFGAGGLGAAFSAVAGPVAIVIAAIAGLVAIFVAMWRESQVFRDAIMTIWPAIQAAVTDAVDTVKQALADNKDSIDILKGAFQMLGDFVGTYVVPIIRDYLVVWIKWIATEISVVITALAKWVQYMRFVVTSILDGVALIVDGYAFMVDQVLTYLANLTQQLADTFGWLPNGVGDALRSASESFRSWRDTSVGTLNTVSDNLRALKDTIMDATQPRTVTITIETIQAADEARRMAWQPGSGIDAARQAWTGPASTSVTSGMTKSASSGSGQKKVDPFKAFVKDMRDSVAQLKARAQLVARGVPEALADSIVGAEGWRRITATLLKGGKKALGDFVRLWSQSAAGKDAIKTQVDTAIQYAKDRLKELQAVADAFVTQVRDFGSTTSLGTDAPISSTSITENLRQRLAIVRQFVAAMRQLAGLGLNPSVRSDIFALGPFDGLKYAQALLEGGKQTIGEVNRLTAQFNSPAVAGQYAKLGQEAMLSSTANYVPPQAVTVAAGGINITVNGEVTAETRDQIRQAVMEGLGQVRREARSSKKAGVR